MNVEQFIERFRIERQDTAEPCLWSDAEIVNWLNDAVEEACQRAHILIDGTSAFTSFTVAAGTEYTQLPSYVLDILRLSVDGRRIDPTSIEELDSLDSRWESREGRPQGWIFERNGTLRLFPTPSENVTVKIRVSRLPIDTLSADIGTGEPEIPLQWHTKLLNWVYRCALMKNETETQDKAKADDYEARFIADFGIRENANVERKHRDKSPHVVQYQDF